MITLERYCDLCGKQATYAIAGMTGRVLLDGRDCGQGADLCDDHRPTYDYPWQPRNTTRMVFHWPGRNGENQYPPRG